MALQELHPVIPDTDPKPKIGLAVFDIDGTVIPFFEIWQRTAAEGWDVTKPDGSVERQPSVLEYFAKSRGMELGFDPARMSDPGYMKEMLEAQGGKEGDTVNGKPGTLIHELRRYAEERRNQQPPDLGPYDVLYNEPERIPEFFPSMSLSRIPPSRRAEVAAADMEMTLRTRQRREELTQFLPGVVEGFVEQYKAGTKSAFLTDGTKSAVVQRLALASKHAQSELDARIAADPDLKAKVEADPAFKKTGRFTFMDMVDVAVSKPDPVTEAALEGQREAPIKVVDPALKPYIDAVLAKHVSLPNGEHKPSPVGLEMIRSQAGVPKDRTVMNGDTYADLGVSIAMADVGEPKGQRVHGAWQFQGASTSQASIALNELIGIPSYKIGPVHAAKAMAAHGIYVSPLGDNGPGLETTLVDGIADLKKHFDFVPAQQKPAEQRRSAILSAGVIDSTARSKVAG